MVETLEREMTGTADFPNMQPVGQVLENLMAREESRHQEPLDLNDLSLSDPFGFVENEDFGTKIPILNFKSGEQWPITPAGMDHLCTVLRINKGFYDTAFDEEKLIIPQMRLRRMMADDYPVPIGFAATEIVPRDRLGVFLINGRVTAFADRDHVRVPSWKILNTIASTVDDAALVRTYHADDSTVTVDLLSPTTDIQIRSILGQPVDFTDLTFGGMSFTHNDAGSGVTQLRTFLWRQWCLNGATIQHPIRMTRFSINDHGEDGAVDRYLDSLGGSTQKYWEETQTKYFDHLQEMADTGYLNADGNIDPELAYAEIQDIPGVPQSVKDMILRAFNSDPLGYTQYGVMNAITSVAHFDDTPYETARKLEAYGGHMVHTSIARCSECRQKLRQRRPRRALAESN